MLVSEEELARRRRELEKEGGYPIPPSQTPWQELQRADVGQLQTVRCSNRPSNIRGWRKTPGVPRHSQ